MKFYKKVSGTDIIPNKQFWIKAPFLIKVYTKFRNSDGTQVLNCLFNMIIFAGRICFHVWSMCPFCERKDSRKTRIQSKNELINNAQYKN